MKVGSEFRLVCVASEDEFARIALASAIEANELREQSGEIRSLARMGPEPSRRRQTIKLIVAGAAEQLGDKSIKGVRTNFREEQSPGAVQSQWPPPPFGCLKSHGPLGRPIRVQATSRQN